MPARSAPARSPGRRTRSPSRTWPTSGAIAPATIRARVVAPDPRSPVTPTRSPPRTVSETLPRNTPGEANVTPSTIRSGPTATVGSGEPAVGAGTTLRSAEGFCSPTMAVTRSSLVTSGSGAVSTISPSRSTATSVQISKTSSRWWEMYKIATPWACSWRMLSNSRCAAPRSSAAVGSSSSRQRVPAASARVISTTWRCSTVRLPQAVSALTSKPQSVMTLRVCSRIRRQSTTPPRRAGGRPRKTFSATVRYGTTMECWNTAVIRPRHAAMSPSEGAGRPSRRTSPASGATRPDRIETRVDLPAPLRPTRPRQRPGCRLRSTPRSACVLPNRLWIPAASTAGAACGSAAGIADSCIRYSGRRGAADAAVGAAVDVAPQGVVADRGGGHRARLAVHRGDGEGLRGLGHERGHDRVAEVGVARVADHLQGGRAAAGLAGAQLHTVRRVQRVLQGPVGVQVGGLGLRGVDRAVADVAHLERHAVVAHHDHLAGQALGLQQRQDTGVGARPLRVDRLELAAVGVHRVLRVGDRGGFGPDRGVLEDVDARVVLGTCPGQLREPRPQTCRRRVTTP